MAKILISINPEHVRNILNGNKKYEYRRTMAKRKIKSLLIYETFPCKKVVAEIQVDDVMAYTPKKLWNKTKDFSGISKKFFDEYFCGKEIAYAYKLGKINKYEKPKDLSDFGLNNPPQSFVYIS